MKEAGLKFWDHEEKPEKKKTSWQKRILVILGSIVGLLIVGFILIGVFYHPTQQAGDTTINQVAADSCKYKENTTGNILALINEYRAGQNIPIFTESPSLSKYQEALLADIQKNGQITDTELNNPITWQQKYSDKGSVVYLTNDIKELGVSSFLTPCNAFEFLKNKNNSELTSANYDSLGIAMVGSDAIILLGKKTDNPNQVAVANQNYINSLRQQSDTIKQQIDSQKADLDAQEQALLDSKAKSDLEKRYKDFLSQITIAVAAENLKSGSRPSSVSCPKAGSLSFSYIADKLSSASSNYGTITVSTIGGKLSSISGLGSYSCSYIGDNISSCSGSNGSLSISNIGGQISSISNYAVNVMSHYSFIGDDISSASEADLGSCNIN